jgi:hypothetical protein
LSKSALLAGTGAVYHRRSLLPIDLCTAVR